MTLKRLKQLNLSEGYDYEVFPKNLIFNKEQLIKYFYNELKFTEES